MQDTLSFIREDFYEPVKERITLGMKIGNCQLSKFYAYNGRLFGTVKAESVTVLYDDSDIYTTDVPKEYQIVITDPTEPSTTPTEPVTEAPVTKVTAKAAKSTIYVNASTTVTPTVKNKVGTTNFKSSDTEIASVNSSGKVTGKKAGTVTITVTNNKVSAKVKINVIKRNQSMTVKAATKTVKYSKLKKSNQTASPLTVKNYKGKLNYKKVSGSTKLSVNSKGKTVVKKGSKKGTYKAVIQVTAAGNNEYNKCTKNVKVTVNVK